jgi:flagellar basal-body rod protein FlgG
MVKSIYTPVSGAIAQERVLEILANNLANLNTNGFKGDRVSFEVLEPEPFKHYNSPLPPANYKVDLEKLFPLVGNEVQYVGIADISRDAAQGPAISTNNQTDLMIEGAGYLLMNTANGTRLTRDGALSVSPEGYLVTKGGDPIQGSRGAIHLQFGDFQINHRGEVYQDGQLIDQLTVVRPSNEADLERVGFNQFMFRGAEADLQKLEHPQVKQGFLEGSNVNAIQNMTAMIMAHRSYEAYQKAVSNFDQIMEKSSNTIGDVRA